MVIPVLTLTGALKLEPVCKSRLTVPFVSIDPEFGTVADDSNVNVNVPVATLNVAVFEFGLNTPFELTLKFCPDEPPMVKLFAKLTLPKPVILIVGEDQIPVPEIEVVVSK